MTTCTTSISSVPFDSIQVLNPSTITSIGPINGTVNKLFRFKITSSYSVSFTVNLTPSLGSTVNAQLSIFSYNETTGLISSIGSVALNNLTTNFTRDFEVWFLHHLYKTSDRVIYRNNHWKFYKVSWSCHDVGNNVSRTNILQQYRDN